MEVWGSLSRLRTSFPTGPAGRRLACLFLSVLALASSAGCQSPVFEVASVKLHKPSATEGGTRESIDSVPGSLTIRNASMSSCIGWSGTIKSQDPPG